MDFKRYPIAVFAPLPIPFREEVLVPTMVNMNDDTGSFKIFPNYKEADDWIHAESLKQLPHWHSQNCQRCIANKDPINGSPKLGFVALKTRGCVSDKAKIFFSKQRCIDPNTIHDIGTIRDNEGYLSECSVCTLKYREMS